MNTSMHDSQARPTSKATFQVMSKRALGLAAGRIRRTEMSAPAVSSSIPPMTAGDSNAAVIQELRANPIAAVVRKAIPSLRTNIRVARSLIIPRIRDFNLWRK